MMVLEGASLRQTPALSPQPAPCPCCHTHTQSAGAGRSAFTRSSPGFGAEQCGLAVGHGAGGLVRGLGALPSSAAEEARGSLNHARSKGREDRLPPEPQDAVGTV